MNRREFTVQSALLLLSGATITITGCGGGGSGSPSGPSQSPAPTGDRVGAITGNHGHSAIVTTARITAGAALALDIRGGASHPHSVELSAAEVTSIGAGQRVAKVSSSEDAHTHTVTFN